MPPFSSVFARTAVLASIAVGLLATAGCRNRRERKVDTVLDHRLVREQGSREPSADRITVDSGAREGATVVAMEWTPACRVREVERKRVRTDVIRGVAGEHFVFGGTFAVGGGVLFMSGMNGDFGEAGSGLIAVGGLILCLVGSGSVLSDIAYLKPAPPGRARSVDRESKPWSTQACPVRPGAVVALAFPGATLSARLDKHGRGSVTIEDWMWKQNDDVIVADVLIDGQVVSSVRLARPAAR